MTKPRLTHAELAELGAIDRKLEEMANQLGEHANRFQQILAGRDLGDDLALLVSTTISVGAIQSAAGCLRIAFARHGISSFRGSPGSDFSGPGGPNKQGVTS